VDADGLEGGAVGKEDLLLDQQGGRVFFEGVRNKDLALEAVIPGTNFVFKK
jgi:hypothetical protein